MPFKVLDAPQLVDDFYLNIIDWSETNNIAVSLARCLYVWNATTCQPVKLHDYAQDQNLPTSVSWSRNG
jgi:cell division cycle 20-like protein 1 (cofactor of APC complex)